MITVHNLLVIMCPQGRSACCYAPAQLATIRPGPPAATAAPRVVFARGSNEPTGAGMATSQVRFTRLGRRLERLTRH